MCRRITCNSCGKPTWAGCGAHVEQVLGDVPKSARCVCRDKAPKDSAKKTANGSLLSRLFGK